MFRLRASGVLLGGIVHVHLEVGKTIINHPLGNGLYHLFMVIWGLLLLYPNFSHIILIIEYFDVYVDTMTYYLGMIYIMFTSVQKQFHSSRLGLLMGITVLLLE